MHKTYSTKAPYSLRSMTLRKKKKERRRIRKRGAENL
jgi:hypothetical protein